MKIHLARLMIGTAVLLLISLTPDLPGNRALAQVGEGDVGIPVAAEETPYGGLNTVPIYCGCSSNFLVTLWDYRTDALLKLLYQPGQSVLYEYYNIFGTYLLGTYKQGGTCEFYIPPYECIDIEADGTMGSQPGTGTSL